MTSRTSPTTCLVLGSTGFIGGHVVRRGRTLAQALGAELVEAPPDLDVRDAHAVRELVQQHAPRYLIHLAASTFVPDSIADPAKTYEVNFIGTLNVLAALVASKFAGRMLFASSAEVYGVVPEDALPIRESQPFAPRTPYAVSKAAGELLCRQHALAQGMDVVVVRPFNVIGAGQSSKFAVSSFARQIAELEAAGGGDLAVGNLDVTRDFVDVDDAVAAFFALLRSGRPGEAYNVCSGTETQLGALLSELRTLSTARIGVQVDRARVRPAEQRRVRGDHGKITTDTGWRPGVSLSASLAAILADWRSRAARGHTAA